jgi:hypothetical protein
MLLAIAGGYFARNAFRYEHTDDAQVHGHVMPLGARINGHVNDVFVSEGQLVRAGEALVTIVWPQVERPRHESGFDSLRCLSAAHRSQMRFALEPASQLSDIGNYLSHAKLKG